MQSKKSVIKPGYKLEQLHHQLLSLEVALQDAYKQNRVSTDDYEFRFEIIQGLHNELKSVQESLQLLKDGDATENDVNLPRIDACTRIEHEVCRQHLDDRIRLTDKLQTDAKRALSWLEKTARGEGNWLTTTLRLSKLRKLLGRINNWSSDVDEEASRLGMTMERLVSSTQSSVDGKNAASNLKGLIQVFHELNRLTGRMAKLREVVFKEEEIIRDMEAWLTDVELTLEAGSSHPPTIRDLIDWSHNTEELYPMPLSNTVDRLTRTIELVEQYTHTESEASERKGLVIGAVLDRLTSGLGRTSDKGTTASDFELLSNPQAPAPHPGVKNNA